MTVTLLHHTPLFIADKAIAQCWAKPCDPSQPNLTRIDRVINKHKHASTAEHLTYSFEITKVTRALLQELSRHRLASPTVKSSRYTLSELKKEDCFLDYSCVTDGEYELATEDALDRAKNYVKLTGNKHVDTGILLALDNLRDLVEMGISNDITKYAMPEAYYTSLSWTINARSLQNFLALRSAPSALLEIRQLAHAIYNALPSDHQFLFSHLMEPIND